jgi:hypothetical protein
LFSSASQKENVVAFIGGIEPPLFRAMLLKRPHSTCSAARQKPSKTPLHKTVGLLNSSAPSENDNQWIDILEHTSDGMPHIL